MLDALQGADRQLRLDLLNTIDRCKPQPGSETDDLLPVLERGLSGTDTKVARATSIVLLGMGMQLPDPDASCYEAMAPAHPAERALRVMLLHYYRPARRGLAGHVALKQHILWLIRNAPECPAYLPSLGLIGDAAEYAQARDLWLEHVKKNPSNATVIGHAAQFFIIFDKALSESLFRQAQAHDPTTGEWHRRLAHLYSLRIPRRGKPDRKQVAAKILDELRAGFAKESDHEARMHMLADLAKAGLEAGEEDSAWVDACAALRAAEQEHDRDAESHAIHEANTVLGRLALRRGDVEKAKRHLLDSVQLRGSPVMRSFGPCMLLADELLAHGERDVVVNYIRQCGTFWKCENGRIARWIDLIQRGRHPHFTCLLR
jgi:hypothetical protein